MNNLENISQNTDVSLFRRSLRNKLTLERIVMGSSIDPFNLSIINKRVKPLLASAIVDKGMRLSSYGIFHYNNSSLINKSKVYMNTLENCAEECEMED